MVFVMSEEQLKAAEIEKVEAQVEEAVEEISEEDLDGVVGGATHRCGARGDFVLW